ncbi:T9SS type A sorting domain-containing protein [Draconibacterium sp. IB214405]|uniref:T9SS type A sorting domain-containing protein n=1 Tax=Draconibacterium sp. IB214405 TaxID=3097352 RepID=UPI002A0B619A|nr:T9SS type A sorting domain-containing protein [Draconibacterium sp. IB214405]MDX8340882.1 T9SS type A sorting domain-containing protein [Draconibacterium sp. IB214405]
MKRYFLLTIFILITFCSFSQIDTKGSEFWIDFHYTYTTDLKIFLSAENDASATIVNNAIGFSQNVTITGGEVASVTVPLSALLSSIGISENAFYITSDDEIAVYGLNYYEYSTDAYAALPVDGLGNEYRIAGYNGGQVSVIATEDNTIVDMISSTGTNLFSTNLDKGEVYFYKGSTIGALVSASKPVAVFSGDQCSNFSCCACDHLIEQLPPTDSYGLNFVVLPSGETDLGSGNIDYLQIIGNEDGTTIKTTSEGTFTLDAGEVKIYQFYEAQQVVADKPVLVVQYGKGTYCGNGSLGDPMMMVIPPQDQFLKGYIVTTPLNFASHYLNIVAPSYGYSNITMDGTVIPASEFTEIGSSGYYGARIEISEGNHTILGAMPFGVFSHGVNPYNSYGYAGGMSLAPVASVDQVSISPSEQTVDIKDDGSVTATVLDSDGIPMEGVLVNFYISGIGDLQGGAYSNASGKAVYSYGRTEVGVDNIYAKVLNISSSTVTINWNEVPPVPVVFTNDITSVDSISATFDGVVSEIGSPNATEHGFCWGTTEDPGFDGEYSNLGVPTEGVSFNKSVTGLSPATKYYVKAYALNELDTVFGEQKAFVTEMIDQEASAPSNINCNSFTVNWIKNSSATGYKLDISESADFSTFLGGYENKLISSNVIVSEDVSGLVNGKTYYYRVKGINSLYNLSTEYSSTFSVLNEDMTAPQVLSKDITVYLDSAGVATITVADIDAGTTDNCGIDTMYLSRDSFDCTLVGYVPEPVLVMEKSAGGFRPSGVSVTLTAIDIHGNSNSSTFYVTVLDTIAPVVHTKDMVISLGEDGVESITTADIVVDSYDACGIESIELNKSSFKGEDVGDNTIVLTATDVNGNTSVSTATVTVRDTIAPELQCRDIHVALNDDGTTRINSWMVIKSDYDAGGIAKYSLDKRKFDCSNIGENLVQVKVTDYAGNFATCVSTVTIADEQAPEVLCQNLEVTLDEQGLASIEPEMVDAGSSDVCGIAEMRLSKSEFTGADLGKNKVTFYVTDFSGNSDSCTTTITVNDNSAPKVVCNTITVELSSNNYELTENDKHALAAGSFDNATPTDSLVIEISPSVFTCEQIGDSVNVEVTVTDEAGNSGSCKTKVYVQSIFDTDLEDVEVSLEAGQCETTIDYPAAFTGESCAKLTLIDGLGIDGLFSVGTTVETWQVEMGEVTDTVSFNVIVTTTNASPTIDVLKNVSVSNGSVVTIALTGIGSGADCLGEDVTVNAAFRNTELVSSLTTNYENGSTEGEISILLSPGMNGTDTITVTVVDESGASIQRSFVLTVSGHHGGNVPPVLLDTIADTTIMATYTLDISISKTLGVLFDDVDDDSLTVRIAPLEGLMPDWISLSEEDTMYYLTCTPAVTDTGCYEFVVSAMDDSGAMAADTFGVCVLPLPVGIGGFSQAEFDVTMYPNPSKGLVNIELESTSIDGTEVSVSNIAGAEVFRRYYLSEDQIQIDLSEHVSGMYLIRIKQDGNQVIKKLVLDKN